MAKKAPQSAPDTGIQPYDFSGDAGQGFENVRSGDLSIPFLMMLQDGSPEVKKSHPDHILKRIPGAQAGHIINTITREIYNPDMDNDKVEFIPASYQKLYVEWTPRDEGGGIVMSHASESILANTRKNDKNQDVLPSGNIIVTTAYFFGFVHWKNDYVRVVLSMTSTQLKKARQWLTLATSIKFDGPNGKYNPPLFSHKYLLSSQPESNDQGSWMGWKIENGGVVSDRLVIDQAREVVREVKVGQGRLAAPSNSSHEDDLPDQ